MIRVEFPDAAGGGRAFALRCHVLSSFGERELFRSLLIDCTVAHLVLTNYVADYINIPCYRNVCQVADYINVHVSSRMLTRHPRSTLFPCMSSPAKSDLGKVAWRA